MYSKEEREEFNRIVKNPLEFLKEELDEGGALCSSIFAYDGLENTPILVSFIGGFAPCVHVDILGQYGGVVSRASYLAFWQPRQTGVTKWRISTIDLSKIYTPHNYAGTAEDIGTQKMEQRWGKAVMQAEAERRCAAVWYFPRGTRAAQTYSDAALFHANSKAQAGEHYVVW
jgi:hypothetical protein|nr:MAG TPA: hypothetical protein [Caudoviricetes sp.]